MHSGIDKEEVKSFQNKVGKGSKGKGGSDVIWDYSRMHINAIVGFTRIAVNFKFHSWFANFKLT